MAVQFSLSGLRIFYWFKVLSVIPFPNVEDVYRFLIVFTIACGPTVTIEDAQYRIFILSRLPCFSEYHQ